MVLWCSSMRDTCIILIYKTTIGNPIISKKTSAKVIRFRLTEYLRISSSLSNPVHFPKVKKYICDLLIKDSKIQQSNAHIIVKLYVFPIKCKDSQQNGFKLIYKSKEKKHQIDSHKSITSTQESPSLTPTK